MGKKNKHVMAPGMGYSYSVFVFIVFEYWICKYSYSYSNTFVKRGKVFVFVFEYIAKVFIFMNTFHEYLYFGGKVLPHASVAEHFCV